MPEIEGVEHRRVNANGIDFHVAEAGEGEAVLLLHGWPQHWFEWRHLLADPPAGLRLIAPDLPGYGWSAPPPHRWRIDDTATDLQALVGELGHERLLLVGHDWGGWLGYELALREPERFRGYLALNIAHPWNGLKEAFPHGLSMLGYQPFIAIAGIPLHRRTDIVKWSLRSGGGDHETFSEEELEAFAAPLREPDSARVARDTYRSFLRDVPAKARRPEQRRLTVPVRVVFGTEDRAIHPSLSDPAKALADDFRVRWVPGAGHFIAEQRPELVRERLLALHAETR